MSDAKLLDELQDCLEPHANRWTNDSRVQVKDGWGAQFWQLMSEVYYRTKSVPPKGPDHD